MTNLQSPRDYVAHWFTKSNISVRDASNRATTFGTLYLDYLQTHAAVSIQRAAEGAKVKRPLEQHVLKFAYEEYVEQKLAGEVRAAANALSFNGGTLEALKTWLKAVTGIQDSKYEAVLAHWCWMVKRRANGLPVKHQIMPILFGPQGGGKTMALERFIEPIAKFRLNLPMSSLGDERMFKAFASNLVVLFDELQNIERTSVTVLKNQITTTFNSFRPLHTNNLINMPQSCSFIGASNKQISENFSDTTGMRRFYQFNALPKLDWATINSIDYQNLWRSIDETLEDGYLHGDLLNQVQEEQTALVIKDDYSTFLEESGLFPAEGAPTKLATTAAVYIAYQDWCAKNGAKAYSSVYFNKRLRNQGLKYQVEANGRKAWYTVAADANVDSMDNKLKVVK